MIYSWIMIYLFIFEVDSIESERIAVDHVAHILPSGDSNAASALSQHLGAPS